MKRSTSLCPHLLKYSPLVKSCFSNAYVLQAARSSVRTLRLFFKNTGFFHLCPKVITLHGNALPTPVKIEYPPCSVAIFWISSWIRTVFTNTGTTEQTDLTTFCIWCKKVDNLDTCFQDLNCRFLLLK